MSHVAVDKDGTEGISDIKPVRDTEKYADAEHPEVMIGNSWVLDDGMDENMVEMPVREQNAI